MLPKRKNNETRKCKTLETPIVSHSESLWNKCTYVPLSMVKLLIAESFNSDKYISEETRAMLQKVLDLPERE